MTERHHLNINGQAIDIEADGSETLLAVLRGRLDLKLARYGCGAEQCGSCTVLIAGKPAYACTARIDSLGGRPVTTLEGLKASGAAAPLLDAFIAEQAGQCGYCITGIMMSAYALLAANPTPSRGEIIAALERHLCRCGSHLRIIRAVERAARGTAATGEARV